MHVFNWYILFIFMYSVNMFSNSLACITHVACLMRYTYA